MYYKKYTDTVQASDYVAWAIDHLYLEVFEIKKLASMTGRLNIFEIEEMFEAARKSIQREAPSEEESVTYHIRKLYAQLIMPNDKAVTIVKEIYNCAVAYDLSHIQLIWQDISDAIDDFEYGTNREGHTLDKIQDMIMTHARKLWHMQPSEYTFKEFLGQKVTAVNSETQFIILLEKGSIVVECPWRIRDTDGIKIGETDIQTNQREWKTVKAMLTGKTIADIQLFEQFPMLIIQFNDLFLDIFHASSFFDGWTLSDDEDFYMFSVHGGQIG